MVQSLRKLRSLLTNRDFGQLAILLSAMFVMALLEVVGIASILPFMRLVAEPELVRENGLLRWWYDFGGFTSSRSLLISVAIAVLCLLTIANLFAALTTWLQYRFAWASAHRISVRLVTTYTGLPYDFFLSHNSADLIKKVASEVSNLVTGVLFAGSEFVARVFVSIVIFGLLMWVQPWLAISVVGILGGAYGVIYVTRLSYLAQLGQERLDANYQFYQTLVEVLSGMKAIKTDGVAPYFVGRFESASKRYSSVHPRFQLVSLVPRYAVETLAFGGVLAIIVYLLAVERSLATALPILSLFALAGYRLLPSLNRAFTAAAQLRHNLPVIDEIHEDINREPDAESPVSLALQSTELFADQIVFKNCVTLQHVAYRYENSDVPVLNDVHLTIPKNSHLALVGSTGSGKTTLIDVLVGLLPPTEGRLYVDDVEITRDNVRKWQEIVGYVPQEVFLYDNSIARNIAFGIDDGRVDMDRVRRAGQISQIDQFVMDELTDGYETVIGERGVRLSGGQRQRIGLARALYRQPMMLLLDEATSALDGVTEQAVIQTLREQQPRLTIIMVSHRLSTVKYCEKICLIEQGCVTEQGSYEELLESNASFREMLKLTS